MPPRHRRVAAWFRALVASTALCVLSAPRVARAWVEVHVTGDDVRVTVDRKGVARVEHRLSLRTAGSPLPSLDLRGVDPDAAFEPDGYVIAAKDASAGSIQSALPVTAELVRPKPRSGDGDGAAPEGPVVRLKFDGRGLPRGVWVLQLRYSTRLAERGLLRADGALTKLRWIGPAFDEGFESARVTFVLPAGPTAPRIDDLAAAADDGAANGPTFLSTLKRGPDTDELQLVRPFVPKGEAVVWSVALDGRAFAPRSSEVVPEPPAAPRAFDFVAPARRSLVLALGGALFVLYALVVALKGREAAAAARSRDAIARPVVPVGTPVRAVAAGLSLAVGVGMQLVVERAVVGSVLVLAAALLAAHRTPRCKPIVRGPGRWLPVRESEVFERIVRPSGTWLDTSTRAGAVVFALLVGAYGAGVAFLADTAPDHAYLVGLDVVALLALFGTGRVAELPPDPVAGRAPLLRAVAKRVRKLLPAVHTDAIRLVPRIRVPTGQVDADELRLALVPRTPLAGFVAIEVGVVLLPGVGTTLRMPEILVRFVAGSECERALTAAARHGRGMRGRRPDERVLLLTPRLPTARMTAAIVAALAMRVHDKARTARPEAAPAASASKKPKKAPKAA